ncbi:MAG: amidohydrolase family protein [Elainellaceae cyanobacterium]
MRCRGDRLLHRAVLSHGHYVREVGLFSLEEAVHRMTGLSASQFRLTDRGVLKAGAFADVVVFDADTILDQASFENPTSMPLAALRWCW